jgi:nucleoside-diphosphate-sugar epimerase
MHVFVTGASGWIGSATVDELIRGGHQVTGLARSDASAAAVEARGAQVLRGHLDDVAGIRRGAADADAVIHLANKHDFANPAVSAKAERDAVQAIAEELVGSNRPFLLASGAAIPPPTPGALLTEQDRSPLHGPDAPRGGSENLALDYVERGVHTVSLRFAPTVHGPGDHGFIAYLVATAREKGVAGYVGDGSNRWSAVARADAATAVRLALEKAPAGTAVHVVAEEGIPTRDIAGMIGDSLGLPTASIDAADAMAHFGWIGRFFGADVAAGSAATRELLGWNPTGPTLAEDLAAGGYRHA